MDDDGGEREETRESEKPVDLTRERESFVRQFIRRGVELTEGLLEENERLRTRIEQLQEQNGLLRAQIASDDAIRDLLRKIETLESERRELLDRSTKLEETTKQSEDRNSEVEQELHDLANLYIASSHLHSTLSSRGVMRHLCELLQQLVGAEVFAIYLVRGERVVPIGADGVALDTLEPLAPGEGIVGEVMLTGMPRILDEPQPRGTLEAPVAAIPLMVRDVAVGAITVASVFEQKSAWAAVDRELFHLMGSHVATALIAANLYAREPGAREALTGLVEQLNLT
ncbi:MAG: GAF domain-containing protein [Sandaracinaceae bacterium]|nr:GAF domain-containing protein [Myxococcales bacterium]MCB9596435.1 GAF domain-containing protein [Sandaracinaceae bacterium]